MFLFRSTIIFLLSILAIQASGSYSIKGKVNLKGSWQNQIFLSTIDKLDHCYNANPEYIINVSTIDDEGNFLLEGDFLPEEIRYYRLYVIKEENSEFDACLYVGGDEHNFVHIALNNNTNLEVYADSSEYAPFANYRIVGNPINQSMRVLGRLVHPSYYFFQIKFPSELKFSQEKLNENLFIFADTCSSIIAGLAAINNTDYDNYFITNREDYMQFLGRLEKSYETHPYTSDYKRKLRYYDDSYEQKTLVPWLISLLLGAFCTFLLYSNWQLKHKSAPSLGVQSQKTKIDFTRQEQKILNLIKIGKSNKEIAAELFIELSTVKSHINKLYSKMEVKDRKSAIAKANNFV